ncbi:MAG: glycosyltransferase, partial [Abditibacteriota bacterium]|nr:glycosyltransferase [Abditibacteriota bacterium]
KDCLRPFSKTFATHTAGCSEYSIRWLYGEKTAKTSFLLHNAIDLDRFTPNAELRDRTRKTLGISDDFVFGTVGRFVYQKNYQFLIDAFALYCQTNDKGKLLLVGDGDERQSIVKKIEKYGIKDGRIGGSKHLIWCNGVGKGYLFKGSEESWEYSENGEEPVYEGMKDMSTMKYAKVSHSLPSAKSAGAPAGQAAKAPANEDSDAAAPGLFARLFAKVKSFFAGLFA